MLCKMLFHPNELKDPKLSFILFSVTLHVTVNNQPLTKPVAIPPLQVQDNVESVANVVLRLFSAYMNGLYSFLHSMKSVPEKVCYWPQNFRSSVNEVGTHTCQCYQPNW